jgi:hypothetical protein
MRYLLLLLALCWTARGANPSFGDFNANQFTTNANKVAIKDGVKLTNAVLAGAITGAYAEFANNVQVDGQLDIVGTGNLQGRALSALSQNGTNGAPAVNFTNSATVTWARSGSNWTANATATGSAGSTNYRSAVVELGLSGTNVTGTIDWAATNVCYRLTLTTNAYFGDLNVNVPATNFFQFLELDLVQDSVGGRTVTFSNGLWGGVNGTFPITTTAGAWDSATLLNSRVTNGNVMVLFSNNLKR